jgi:hypothetical protein
MVFEPNWFSAANAHCPEHILSKSRSDFGVEVSSRSPHFCGAEKNNSPQRCPISLRNTLGQPVRRSRVAPMQPSGVS